MYYFDPVKSENIRIQNGSCCVVESVSSTKTQVELELLHIEQRNWSRIATGMSHNCQEQTFDKFFIKQYVDKAGKPHSQLLKYELAGTLVAQELFKDVAHVPSLLYQNESLLLNVFEFKNVVSVDVLLRKNETLFNQHIDSIIKKMGMVLDTMQTPRTEIKGLSLPVKRRNYGSGTTAINFKGFEIRNVGLPLQSNNEISTDTLVLFDLVRPYWGPIEEAAAKLFISIGFLNWGSPLSRFMKGPDVALMEKALPILKPWLNRDAIEAELQLQTRFRTVEFKGIDGIERTFKKIVVNTLGKVYLSKLKNWFSKVVT